MDMTQEILDMIFEGDLDGDLDKIKKQIFDRRALLGLERQVDEFQQNFRVGDMIKITGRLKPNYLFGHEFLVNKVNTKTVVIDVPNDPKFRRFAGSSGVRIPKTAVKKIS